LHSQTAALDVVAILGVQAAELVGFAANAAQFVAETVFADSVLIPVVEQAVRPRARFEVVLSFGFFEVVEVEALLVEDFVDDGLAYHADLATAAFNDRILRIVQ